MKLVLSLSLLLLLSACKEDKDGNVVLSDEEQAALNNPQEYIDNSTNPPESNNCGGNCVDDHLGEAKGIIVGVVKSGLDKSKIQGAEVNLDGQSFVTFEAGTFVFNTLVIGQPVLISFSHPNFIPTSSEVMIKYGTSNFIEKFLTPIGMKKTFQDGQMIVLNNREAIIKAFELMNPDGEIYQGDIEAAMSYLSVKSKEEVDAFPGYFEGETSADTTVPMVVNGMVSVDFRDKNNKPLELAQDAEVTFPATTTIEGDPDTIPTWFFNKSRGVWEENGFASKQPDGTYMAYIPKAGTWAIAQPMEEEFAHLESGIVMEKADGPHAGVDWIRIYARGEGWRGRSGYTDENGKFSIPVYPHKKYTLRATATFKEKVGSDGKTYKGEYTAETNFQLKELEPGQISDEKY